MYTAEMKGAACLGGEMQRMTLLCYGRENTASSIRACEHGDSWDSNYSGEGWPRIESAWS